MKKTGRTSENVRDYRQEVPVTHKITTEAYRAYERLIDGADIITGGAVTRFSTSAPDHPLARSVLKYGETLLSKHAK